MPGSVRVLREPGWHPQSVKKMLSAGQLLMRSEVQASRRPADEPGVLSDGKQVYTLESSRAMGPLGKVWVASKR